MLWRPLEVLLLTILRCHWKKMLPTMNHCPDRPKKKLQTDDPEAQQYAKQSCSCCTVLMPLWISSYLDNSAAYSGISNPWRKSLMRDDWKVTACILQGRLKIPCYVTLHGKRLVAQARDTKAKENKTK